LDRRLALAALRTFDLLSSLLTSTLSPQPPSSSLPPIGASLLPFALAVGDRVNPSAWQNAVGRPFETPQPRWSSWHRPRPHLSLSSFRPPSPLGPRAYGGHTTLAALAILLSARSPPSPASPALGPPRRRPPLTTGYRPAPVCPLSLAHTPSCLSRARAARLLRHGHQRPASARCSLSSAAGTTPPLPPPPARRPPAAFQTITPKPRTATGTSNPATRT
jgi:hypothetical protein